MSTQIIIMFPYSGFNPETETGKRRQRLFWKMIDTILDVDAFKKQPPIVILNRDTENRHLADAFLNDSRCLSATKQVTIRRTWSVDTCQMWLSGWGKVLDADKVRENDRIVQLPGDIDIVDEDDHRIDFFNELSAFISLTNWDMIIGDFTSGDNTSAKELVDTYGTFALMANWFPEVAQGIRKLKLTKPRSEFLNIRIKTLRELLTYRKFAYEQTLNMLIRSWEPDKSMDGGKKGGWKYSIHPCPLGNLKDDSTFREYTDCLDQIERTERMLKLLWREMSKSIMYDSPQKFIDQYDVLDRRSTSIRENSRIILGNMLGLESQR